MPVKVYIWDAPHGIAMGHASMSLSDGTHISWWPSGNRRKSLPTGHAVSAPANPDQTLEADINLEEREPDRTFVLRRDLDEEWMAEVWRKFRKDHKMWHVKDLNCATVVSKILIAGGALRYVSGDVFKFWESDGVWTPPHIVGFINDFEDLT